MGIFKSIFGKVNIQKTFDTVAKGIDQLSYTKEEKAQAVQECIKAQAEFVSNSYAESTARAITRRIIACSIISFVMLACIYYLVLLWYNESMADKVWNFLYEFWLYPFIAVIGFYFSLSAIRLFKGGKS